MSVSAGCWRWYKWCWFSSYLSWIRNFGGLPTLYDGYGLRPLVACLSLVWSSTRPWWQCSHYNHDPWFGSRYEKREQCSPLRIVHSTHGGLRGGASGRSLASPATFTNPIQSDLMALTLAPNLAYPPIAFPTVHRDTVPPSDSAPPVLSTIPPETSSLIPSLIRSPNWGKAPLDQRSRCPSLVLLFSTN